MILVIDAGYQGVVAWSACSTLPVSASITSSASAAAGATDGGAIDTAAQVAARSIAVRREKEWRGFMRFWGPVVQPPGNERFHRQIAITI